MRWKVIVALLLAGIVWTIAPHPAVADGDAASAETIALYAKKCAMCHGKDGVAKKMAEGSANLNDKEWQASTSVEEIEKEIAEGVGKMKPMASKLSPEEITAIAKYVISMK